MEFSARELYDETGRPGDFVAPPGMSGSLLWATGRSQVKNLADWTPAMSRVVGLVHAWDKDRECLVGTRVEILRGFLLDSTTNMRADGR